MEGDDTKNSAKGKKDEENVSVSWSAVDVLADQLQLEKWAVKNTVELLDSDNTVPFIARYRREQTNNMEADTLRDLQDKYTELKTVQQKIQTVHKAVVKLRKMNNKLKASLASAQTMSEVEHLYAPYKTGSKRTLAERARELGLEKYATGLLEKPWTVKLGEAINTQKKGLTTLAEVETGVQHIIADVISKDKDTMDKVRELCKFAHVTLESTKSNALEKKAEKAEKKGEKKATKTDGGGQNKVDPEKFKLYFNFTIPVKYAKPHQVLAINRGESLKVLTVHVRIPEQVSSRFSQFCRARWLPRGADDAAGKCIMAAVDDAYKRLIQPLMVRHFRSDLTKNAERASVEVFSGNLKQLLLAPPVRGKAVLGVDPGFRHGCKWCVLSPTGAILEHGVSPLTEHRGRGAGDMQRETARLAACMKRHRCETVAIGNGTACRETEKYFSDQIQAKSFAPLNVAYCIVNEAGASVYSASDEAKQEMPDIDISIRGAVSIGRRLQDPLAELVKAEPRHLGVGMYQHDVAENQLNSALGAVVEECVSFVGVDVNSASLALLRRVAGLSVNRAKKIIEHRDGVAPFTNRHQLLKVKGIGAKVFEQCAGFIRVTPQASSATEATSSCSAPSNAPANAGKKRKATSGAGSKSKKARLEDSQLPNPLDMTSIHPESYAVADKLIENAGANKGNIGDQSFIKTLQKYTAGKSLEALAEQQNVGVPTMQLILDGLQQPLGHDLREEFEKPLFKQGLRSLADLKSGSTVTGKVTNVTHFGAFVDIGVGQDGLIHSSRMMGHKLALGHRVEALVEQVEVQRKRIGLKLVKIL